MRGGQGTQYRGGPRTHDEEWIVHTTRGRQCARQGVHSSRAGADSARDSGVGSTCAASASHHILNLLRRHAALAASTIGRTAAAIGTTSCSSGAAGCVTALDPFARVVRAGLARVTIATCAWRVTNAIRMRFSASRRSGAASTIGRTAAAVGTTSCSCSCPAAAAASASHHILDLLWRHAALAASTIGRTAAAVGTTSWWFGLGAAAASAAACVSG